MIATVITSLFYVRDYPKVIPVLFLTLGFGIIGFLDDYLKVVLRRSDGLLPWQKFSLQVVVTGSIYVLSGELYRCRSGNAYPILVRSLSGPWMAGSSGSLFCSDRNRKWCKLYRWSGWTGIQCNIDRCGISFLWFPLEQRAELSRSPVQLWVA